MKGIHPSEFIAEELIARNWSLDDLAARMAINDPDPERAYGIHRLALEMYDMLGPDNKMVRMGKPTAQALGRAFGTSAEMWTNLENAWLAA